MNPKTQTKAQLLAALDQIRAAVIMDDSFEGSISYEIAGPDTFKVQAFWRVGNSEGQGGSICIGE